MACKAPSDGVAGPIRPEPERLVAAIEKSFAGRSDWRVAYDQNISSREYAA